MKQEYSREEDTHVSTGGKHLSKEVLVSGVCGRWRRQISREDGEVREGDSRKVTFKLRHEGWVEIDQGKYRGRSILGFIDDSS